MFVTRLQDQETQVNLKQVCAVNGHLNPFKKKKKKTLSFLFFKESI